MRVADSKAIQIVEHEPDPKLTDNARRVLEKRYLKKDDKGRVIETPKELFARVAWNLAQADRNYGADEARLEETARRFYRMMADLEFLPNSPTLMNAGLELQQLSACFVLPVDDSLIGIFESLKHQALIHQCLAGESLIMTDRGLVAIGDAVDAFSVDTDSGSLPMSHHWVRGREPVFELRTNHGHSIRATAEHRFLIVAAHGGFEWRRLSQLRVGDWAVLSAGRWLGREVSLKPFHRVQRTTGPGQFERKPIDLPAILTDDLAELIGLYMGDGSNSQWGIRFTGNREEIDRVRYLAKECFGVEPTVCPRRSIWEASILRLDLKEWWQAQGFTKKSSLEAFVPQAILHGPESCVQAFVRGLFAADGCARESGYVTLATSSRTLVRQIPVVLFHLGIPSRIYKRGRREGGYQISICSKQGFEVFRRDIGFGLPSKDNRLAAIAPYEIFVRGERVPNQKEPLRNWYAGLSTQDQKVAKLTVGGAMWMRRYELSRHHIGVLHAQGLQLMPAIEDRARENYLYSQVTEVVPAGEAEVYDLTVELKHSYIANGFVSHNSGGGTGFSFSRLRPKGDFVKSTMGVASGPVSFMKIFDAATQTVKQGGRRRGANMGILRVDHPDILEFITCKDKTSEVTNFNISVAVTDKFLEAVKEGTKYDLVNPRSKQVVGQLDAREVLDKIAYQAWKNGEPGLFFIDENNRRQPTPNVGEMEATNPCGEEPLLPYESCNLGSIDLQRHLRRDARNAWEVDWEKLERTIRTSVRALDNVIDMSAYPIKEIEEMTDATRKIGLGVMGFARVLFALEVPYDSKEGVEWGRKIMKFIQEIGYSESARLADERGTYPAWEGSRQWEKGLKVRNSYVTTVAPTGTISMIADTSGGCEPEFSLIWYKRVMDGEELPYFLDYFEEVAKREGFWREDLVKKILDNHGSPRGLKDVPEKWQRVFATAHDVSSEWHVRMQAGFQDYSDAAVSKTINMPREATVEDVKKAYLLAFELHCKGITVYRDGSREDQVLNIGVAETAKPKEVHVEVPAEPVALRPRARPDVITGRTQKILTGYGALYVTVNEDEKGLFEVFAQIGRGGGYTASFTEGIARLVSLCLRSGVPVDEIIDQLEGIRSPRIAVDHGERVYSIPDAIAKAIKRHIGMQKTGVQPAVETFDELGGAVETDVELEKESRDAAELLKKGLNPECPECGKSLVFEEGCVKCHACGYSEC
ncbi:MAG TPA: adenosylcobalamin-dependent ribonucleoside-diphosphate reductase [Thermoplasmata archaeon]|nr:adenosylcobalamin-dependent ribonucleoside-diphosphate reductase [Thermoplasmata archaeon]